MKAYNRLSFGAKVRFIIALIILAFPQALLYGITLIGKGANILGEYIGFLGVRFIRFEWETEAEKEWREN